MPDNAVNPAGLRIVKLLVGCPPRTVADLIRATGVTRTAVTEQLSELVDAQLVERSTERPVGRGRPRHLYRATNNAMAMFAGNQRWVVPVLWQAMRDVGGEGMVKKIRKRLSRAIADTYICRITANKPLERLRQLMGLLAAEGGIVEMGEDRDGQRTFRKRSCPFLRMSDDRQSICRIDQEMMSAVVGRPVRRTACRHEGAPCCTFEIVGE